jgi:hypothetical protein
MTREGYQPFSFQGLSKPTLWQPDYYKFTLLQTLCTLFEVTLLPRDSTFQSIQKSLNVQILFTAKKPQTQTRTHVEINSDRHDDCQLKLIVILMRMSFLSPSIDVTK